MDTLKENKTKMNKVIYELTRYKPYSLECEGCNTIKIGIVLYSFTLESFVCSKKCVISYKQNLPLGHPIKNTL